MLERIRKHSLTRFLHLLGQDALRIDIFKDAYAMAYTTLFSLIPSLAATFAVISLFTPMFGANSKLIDQLESFILRNLATGSGEQAIQYLENFLANTDFTKIGVTGFAATMVTLILLLRQIESALNRIFSVAERRNPIERFFYFWTFLTLGTLCAAITIGTVSTLKMKYLDLSVSAKVFGDILYLSGQLLFFFLMYKVGPNRHIPWKSAIIGALVSTTLLTQAIRFFSFYISSFTSYKAVYGALSALPIFLFWLYVIWLITLFGALVVKRHMDGLPRANFRSPKLKESIRDEYFEILLPFLVLIKTYEPMK